MKKKTLEELNRLSIDQYKNLKKNPIIIILDNLRSMSNVGSIFRLCDAFAVEKLILCGITPFPPQREINKTALGAQDSVKWEYFDNIIDVLEMLKDDKFQIIGIEQTTNSIMLNKFKFQNSEKYAFILGNEVEGINENALGYCKKIIEIPQFGTKHSINVSNSAAIILWDVCKATSLQLRENLD